MGLETYPLLSGLTRLVDPRVAEDSFEHIVLPYLTSVWLDDYHRGSPSAEVVQTKTSGFSYLFDIEQERLIAAWGVSRGRHGATRDASRMAGAPRGAGPLYHRGHAIPHRLGGPTDINLVPQLGRINIGPFRPLERQAVATPGSLYFTYWRYAGTARARDGRPGQVPTGVDQGLLTPGGAALVTTHGN